MNVILVAAALAASQTSAESALEKAASNEALRNSIINHAEPLFECAKKFSESHETPPTGDAAKDDEAQQQLIGELGKACGVSAEVAVAKASVKSAFPEFNDEDAEAVAGYIVGRLVLMAAFAGP